MLANPTAGVAKPTRAAFNWRPLVSTTVAFILAFLVGAILMVVADPKITAKYQYFFARPGDALGATFTKVGTAYGALLQGAFGGWSQITFTTWHAAPLILAGLGVGLGFRAGLFNIGAQGQAVLGAIAAAYIGFTWHLPPVLHVCVALLGGLLAGAMWAAIAGLLRAYAGAHEVIVTIMLNYIALGCLTWVLSMRAFQRPNSVQDISPFIDQNAVLYELPGSNLHAGFILALVAAGVVWFILERSTLGFTIRAVGTNPSAARTAGMSVARTTAITLALSGALAGLAGTMSVLAGQLGGQPTPLSQGIVGTVGFDAITVALLGRSKPAGIILAGLLFGALHAGGVTMVSQAGVSNELTTLIQALIVMFVAAPLLVEQLLPFLRARKVQAKEA
ncbi:MAG: ABC transporter permease [Propionibacteriaceae bacterium]